jgi:hypothetical protein
MTQNLLQDCHIGAGQNGPCGKRVAKVVQIDGAPQTHLRANTIMGLPNASEVRTGFSRAGEHPLVARMSLATLLKEGIHFLGHPKSTLRILCLPTLNRDRAVDEIQIRICHPGDFIALTTWWRYRWQRGSSSGGDWLSQWALVRSP